MGLLAGAGGALGYTPLRSALAQRLELDEGHLRRLGRTLSGPRAWRAFLVEQRALVHQLPVLDRQLNQIAAPTIVVAGAADHVVPANAARAVAKQIPAAQLVLLPRAGHLLPQLHPAQLAEIIAGAGGEAGRRAARGAGK